MNSDEKYNFSISFASLMRSTKCSLNHAVWPRCGLLFPSHMVRVCFVLMAFKSSYHTGNAKHWQAQLTCKMELISLLNMELCWPTTVPWSDPPQHHEVTHQPYIALTTLHHAYLTFRTHHTTSSTPTTQQYTTLHHTHDTTLQYIAPHPPYHTFHATPITLHHAPPHNTTPHLTTPHHTTPHPACLQQCSS